MQVIETETVDRDYGMHGTNAIIDHPRHGRLLLRDGFGGMDDLRGGAVRWEHGIAVQLQPTDTLASLRAGNDYEHATAFERVVKGYDDSRPVLDWTGDMVAQVAKSAGL